MKKFFVSLFVLSFILAPVISSAQSLSPQDLQTQINALLEQLRSLQEQLRLLQGNTAQTIVTDVTPSSGQAGTVVSIHGTGFGATNEITFNGVKITGRPSRAYIQLGFVIPAGTPAGTYPITVTNETNNLTSNNISFTVTSSTPPTFASQYLEAESGTIVSPAAVGSDTSASGGQFVSSNTANSGSVSVTLTLPAGNYYLWGRTLSPSGDNDSFTVSVDNGAGGIWDTAEQTWSPNYQWTRVTNRNDNGGSPVIHNTPGHTFTLTSGSHTFTFTARDLNTKLDEIFITTEAGAVPTGAQITCISGFVFDSSGKCQPTSPAYVLKVVSPNGGESLTAGQTYRIKWSQGREKVTVWLLDNPTRLGKILFSAIPNNGYIDWTVSPLTSADLVDNKNGSQHSPSGQYVIFVSCADNDCTVDDSDSPFTITSSNQSSITVTYPNGGENLVESRNTNITWRGGVYPVQVGVVNANFPTDKTVVGWIQTNANADGTLGWDTYHIGPLDYQTSHLFSLIPPGQYKILLVSKSPSGAYCYGQTSTVTDCVYDASDASFTITSVQTTLTDVTPSTGPAGTSVSMHGTGFGATNTITFNGVKTTGMPSRAYIQLGFVIPAGTPAGTYPITVTNEQNGQTSNTLSFTVAPPISNTTSVTLNPAHDYYFHVRSGTATLGDLSTTFIQTTNRLVRTDALYYMANNPPLEFDSAASTYYRFGGSWYKVGISDAIPETTPISAYFIVRKVSTGVTSTLIIPSNVSYDGVTDINGRPRPWPGQTSQPVVSDVAPSSGPVGTSVTIHGTGFTATGNKVKFGDLGSENNPSYSLNSSDGRTLTFTVPLSNYLACWSAIPRCLTPTLSTQPGAYGVSVINANGTSNAVTFTVTSILPPSFVSQYLEAESGTIVAPAAVGTDTSASGGQFVSSNTANSGSVSFTLTLGAGNYYLWGRTLSPSSDNDSFTVSVDNGAGGIWDTAEKTWSPNYQWTRVTDRNDNGGAPVVQNTPGHTFALTSGTHTFTFKVRDLNTKLDRIFITADVGTVPTSNIAVSIASVSMANVLEALSQILEQMKVSLAGL